MRRPRPLSPPAPLESGERTTLAGRLRPLALLSLLAAVLVACGGGGGPLREVAFLGLEAVSYVNGAITFEIAVTGGPADSLELRRDGELFALVEGSSHTWDSTGAPEASYSFVARARRGETVVDSRPRVVVVDRTAAALSLTVTPSADPMVLPGGSVLFAATASDANGVPGVEFLDGDTVVGLATSEPYQLQLDAVRGLHAYRARVVDRAGNIGLSATTTVPIYERQTVVLDSEATLDGCVEAGYEPALFWRDFLSAFCTWTTSYPILHFFSFDRSAYPGALVEAATLRFTLLDGDTAEGVAVASVHYETTADAPPTAFVYPFVSTVSEETMALAGSSFGTVRHELDVTALAQADADGGRARSQFRLRSPNNGPGGLGGNVFFAEVGDERAPQLRLDLLAP